MKVQNFRQIAVLYLEIRRHKVRPSQKGTSHQFQHYPRKPGLIIRNQIFMTSNCFPDSKWYPLQISAILNKNKNVYITNFT